LGQVFTACPMPNLLRSAVKPGALGPSLGLLGVAFVIAVAGAKVASARLQSDLELTCNAPEASGLIFAKDAGRLTQWIRDRLSTPQGGRLFASLRDLPLEARASTLRSGARAAGLSTCPMADAYEEAARQAVARRDVQKLCSTYTFPGLSRLQEALRLQMIEEWISEQPTDGVVRALAEPLWGADNGRARADLLRDAAYGLDLYSCDVARVMAQPAVFSCEP
jgi:hypothetical protein